MVHISHVQMHLQNCIQEKKSLSKEHQEGSESTMKFSLFFRITQLLLEENQNIHPRMKPHLPHTPKELQVAQLAKLWPKQLPPGTTRLQVQNLTEIRAAV